MLLELEGFNYAISLDLNIEYYHIQLSKSTSKLSTIIILRGNIDTSIKWELLIGWKFYNRK